MPGSGRSRPRSSYRNTLSSSSRHGSALTRFVIYAIRLGASEIEVDAILNKPQAQHSMGVVRLDVLPTKAIVLRFSYPNEQALTKAIAALENANLLTPCPGNKSHAAKR